MSSTASFKLNKYLFEYVKLEFKSDLLKDINVSFNPTGVFKTEDKSFLLEMLFTATYSECQSAFLEVKCQATFDFKNVNSLEDIPEYFYKNAIAILFPYIRAFVSTVTLQANIPPLLLPTYNLSDLEKPLKENTKTQ